MDDLLVPGETFKEERKNSQKTLMTLDEFGIQVNFKKSSLVPTQKLTYLGVEVDCKQKVFRAPVEDLNSTKILLNHQKSRKDCRTRDLAQLDGMMMDLTKSVAGLKGLEKELMKEDGLTAQTVRWFDRCMMRPNTHIILKKAKEILMDTTDVLSYLL